MSELDGPDCPEPLEYVWLWFRALSYRRGSNGWGPNPLGWPEIEAWARMQGVTLTPFEFDCLEALEGAYFRTRPKPKQKP
jgi:hypothetical protein